jgi:membrane carboxypeptidase/penicillin-binding protein
MQLVRNLYQPVGTERTFERKLKEACLSLKLYDARGRDWILETYMNQVYYGNRAYGVEAAAQTYFSSPRGPHLAEAALIAGLPLRRPATSRVRVRRRKSGAPAMLDRDITNGGTPTRPRPRLHSRKVYTRIRRRTSSASCAAADSQYA